MLSDFLLWYGRNGIVKGLRKSCYRKFCRWNRGTVFTVETDYGTTMKVIIGDNVDNTIYLNRYFERGTSQVISELSTISNCLVDVGCNIGYFSCLFGRLNSNADIHCIDPNPDMIERATENLQLSGVKNYKVYNYGVGSKNDKLKFYLPRRRHSTGSFIEQKKYLGKVDVLDVHVRRLRDIICIDDLDNAVLKIDAEGFEWEILSGLSDADVQKFDYVIFEFATEVLKYSGDADKSIFALSWLEDYEVFTIMSDGGLEPFSYVEDQWYSTNICLVRKGARKIPSQSGSQDCL